MKRTIAILLSLIMIFSLVGCGSGKDDSASDANAQPDGAPEQSDLIHYEYFDLPDPISFSYFQVLLDNGLYIAGKDAAKNLVHGFLTEKGFTSYPIPDGTEKLVAACKMNDNIAVLIDMSNESEVCDLSLYEFSLDGNILSTVALEDPIFNKTSVFSLSFLNDKFYFLSDEAFICTGIDGDFINSVDYLAMDALPGIFESQCVIGDRLAVSLIGNGAKGKDGVEVDGTEIYLVNPDTMDMELIYSDTHLWTRGIYSLNAETLLFMTDSSLRSINIDTKQEDDLLSLANITNPNSPKAINPEGFASDNYERFYCYPLNESDYICLGTDANSLILIKPGPDNESEKTGITILCFGSSMTLNKLVGRFNETNPDYNVMLIQAPTDSVKTSAKIITDPPDIYFFNADAPIDPSIEEEFFEDMYPYIDSDPDLNRDSFPASLLKQLECNGSLYLLPFDYMIWTFLTPKNIEGAENMSIGQLLDTMKGEYPGEMIFQPTLSRSDMWYWMSNLCQGSFVDEQAKTCSFDSEEYAQLLDSLMLLPESGTNEDGTDAMLQVQQVGTLLRMSAFEQVYGENFSFIGCPCGGRSNGSSFDLQQCFAVSGSCADKEGAWKFLRTWFDSDIINDDTIASEVCIPAANAQLDSMLRQTGSDEGYSAYGMQIHTNANTNSQLKALIDRTNTLMNKNPRIISIMTQQAEPFFKGQISPQEAAANTQSKVSIYLSEIQ